MIGTKIVQDSQKFLKLIRNCSNRGNLSITEQKVDIGNGLNINYVKSTANLSARRAVICMPGSCGSCWSDFKPQIENLPALLEDYHLFAWDPPGYGRSIPPKRKFTVDFLEKDADYVNQLMKTLGYQKYSVIGWSDGGHSALLLAGKYPESVDKLVAFATNSFVTPEEISHFDSIRDLTKWSPKKLEPMKQMYGAEGFKEMWGEWLDIYQIILKERNGDICSSWLKHITADTLLLHGEKDPGVHFSHMPYLLKNIKKSKLVTFPKGKHDFHLTFHKGFNKVVAEFLNN